MTAMPYQIGTNTSKVYYKMDDTDYANLYLLATPREISNEFGVRAHHPSHIYKIFKRLGYDSEESKARRLKGQIVRERPDFISEAEAKELYEQETKVIRDEYFKRMWRIIYEHENRWNNKADFIL